LTLRYEDLLEAPTPWIAMLAGFIGLEPDPDWIAAATAMVGRGQSSWEALPEPERRELEAACAPGFAALVEHGVYSS
jgi:hypothetical protein